MSFVTNSIRHGSVKSRLTVASAIALTAMALFSFLILYMTLSHTLAQRIDEALAAEWGEFQAIFRDGGMAALAKEIRFEQDVVGTRGGFMRIYDKSDSIIDSHDLEDWGKAAEIDWPVSSLNLNQPEFDTLRSDVNGVSVRRLHGLVAPGTAVLIAYTMEQNRELLATIRNRSAMALTVMVALAILVAWFIAQRAMRGVDAVSNVAETIASGRIDLRVNSYGGGREVERLADSFNSMLDRIANLIREIKETNDNITHDLRSPIARIRVIAESLLTTENSPEKVTDLSSEMIVECDNLLSIADTMLDIAEMEAGVASMQISEVQLTDLLGDVCDLFRPAAEERGIRIELNLNGPVSLSADRARLQRALSNILDNALKYSPDGGTISVAVQELSGSVQVEISDSGNGIDDDDLPHIFDRFYRGDKSRASSGNGLGLGVVRAIVSAHGGTVTVSNNVGQGATFRIRLPLGTTDQREHPAFT